MTERVTTIGSKGSIARKMLTLDCAANFRGMKSKIEAGTDTYFHSALSRVVSLFLIATSISGGRT